MGRLIDANSVYNAIQITTDNFGVAKHVVETNMLDMLAKIPTVEAIPKADYEARLKADMVAMLTELQLELDEMKITKVRSAGFAPYSKDLFRRGVNCSKEIIQQKIDSLKGVEDGNE